MRTMRTSIVALPSLLLTLLRPVSGQSIVPTSSSGQFPGCAVGCTVLLQAQSSCVPPNVPTSAQINYENCFCQSTSLQSLYSSPDQICAAECTIETDRDQLRAWFTNFCQVVGQGVDPLTTASVTVVTITITNSAAPTASITGTGAGARPAQPSNKSWIEGHWQWVLMLGILAIGLPLLAWLFVWLKRRHRRRTEQQRATASGFPSNEEKRAGARAATPELWGPHQHMHHTKGFEYHNDPAILGSGAVAASSKRDRRSKRRSLRRNAPDIPETSEYTGSRQTSRPTSRPATSSRQPSAKGKARGTDEIMPIDSRGSHLNAADRSRSRSQRRIDSDSDIEQNAGDAEHQRRLREVRGSRRRLEK